MSRYQVFSTAKKDLREIIHYIGEGRPQAATNLLRRLTTAFERLGNQPGIGHSRRDLSDQSDLRFWRVDRYLIVYRIHPTKAVRIIRVLHGSRDIAGLLEDGPPAVE